MGKNQGKIFEEDFQKSVNPKYFMYRLKDAAGWSNSENTRFTPSNICDFFLYGNDFLYPLELKSTKQKSLSFKLINEKHLDKLVEAGKRQGVRPYLIINFREVNKTFAISCFEVRELIKYEFMTNGRKSISIQWLEDYGIRIPQSKKRVRWWYDVESIMR